MNMLRTPVADPAGELVKVSFSRFLQTFKLSDDDNENLTFQQKLISDYNLQITQLIHNHKTTLYVDYQHVCQHIHCATSLARINGRVTSLSNC